MNSISLVVPCYHSANLIPALVERSLAALHPLGKAELLLVDDGSSDRTWEAIRQAASSQKGLRALRLSRNYGEHQALWAGFRHAKGDFIFSMDDDLQHAPEEIGVLLAELKNGRDLVYGQYERNRHSLLRRIGSRWNGWTGSLLLGRPPGLHLSSFRGIARPLLDRALAAHASCLYVDAVLLRYSQSLGRARITHRESALPESRYNLWKLLSLHRDALLGGEPELPLVAETLP